MMSATVRRNQEKGACADVGGSPLLKECEVWQMVLFAAGRTWNHEKMRNPPRTRRFARGARMLSAAARPKKNSVAETKRRQCAKVEGVQTIQRVRQMALRLRDEDVPNELRAALLAVPAMRAS